MAAPIRYGPTVAAVDNWTPRQSRLESGIESTLNIATGFIISWLVWVGVASPILGHDFNPVRDFALTSLFTVTSWLRSYAWRRFFATSTHRRIHHWIQNR